jgi:hypothetical protein
LLYRTAMLVDLDTPLGVAPELVAPEGARQRQDDERRGGARFRVPGCLVRVPSRPYALAGSDADARDMLVGFMPALWTERREVIDLSQGGLAFESRSPIARGRPLRMQLWIPGVERPLELCAQTRWCKRLLGRQYCVGVRFEAFAARPGCNSPAALELLRQLEAKHGMRSDD